MARAKGRDTRRPWIKWYTRDWRADAPLRMCSYAARGFWADLISLMAESKHFGFLLVEDVVPTAKQLAGLLGGTEREVTKLRTELGEANVYSVTGMEMPEDVASLVPADMPHGVILSRRMVRDKAKADQDSANGKGGGNPILTGADNQGVNPHSNPQKSETRLQISDPNGSGADAPSDPVKLLFDEGVRLLTETGSAERSARTIIGKWRSEQGNEATLAAIRAAREGGITEPIAWITTRFAGKPREDWNTRRIREGMKALGL